ncbi:MAG TPA: hypothetical protein PKD86_18815, partial [Gemmatales bacterium]|nr:hypothetical protein [Gemmatales bacterium]
RLVDTDPPTAVDLASELRASVEALDRPEVGELTVLLRRMLERHGAPAAASCLRVLQELENLLEVATGGGA